MLAAVFNTNLLHYIQSHIGFSNTHTASISMSTRSYRFIFFSFFSSMFSPLAEKNSPLPKRKPKHYNNNPPSRSTPFHAAFFSLHRSLEPFFIAHNYDSAAHFFCCSHPPRNPPTRCCRCCSTYSFSALSRACERLRFLTLSRTASISLVFYSFLSDTRPTNTVIF